jgi:hypothetical protein
MPVSKNVAPDQVPEPGPGIGRIVLYRLGTDDAEEINKRRSEAFQAPAHAWGSQSHVGNQVAAGQQYPAVVVRKFSDGDTVNLQVLLDGADSHWATLRALGDEDGQWSWPVRS